MGTFLLLVPVKETLVSEELVELLVVLSPPIFPKGLYTFLARLDAWVPEFAKSHPNVNAWKTIFSAEIIS